MISLFAAFGLAWVVAGIFTLRFSGRVAASGTAPPHWTLLRCGAFALGAVLGVSQFSADFFLGYPYSTEKGLGTAVGFPFFVAYFDSAGRDYLGPLSVVAATGNALAWFMVPHFAIALYAWRRRQHPEQ